MPKCRPQARFIPATFAWAILLAATSLFFCFPCQYLYEKYFLIIPIYEGIVTLFVLANFSLATFMDPGIIPKASPDEDRDDDFRAPLYKNVEINGITVRMKWCVTCQFYRPPRCSHCSVCNHCIETFDHHCPWVNNCIGRRNYRFFFMFLVSLSIHMVSIFCFCLIFVLDHYDKLRDAATIVSFVIMGVITVLFIPIIGLTGFHVVLVARGRTTNEQVTGKFRGGYNPFSQNCWRNCCLTLCGPLYPSLSAKSVKSLKGKPKQYTLNKGQQTNSSQLKVYMDNSNGVRVPHQNSYSKMSPGHEIDLEAVHSQSQDCEPTPPVIRHGSKNNFFIESDNHTDKIVPRKGSLRNHHYSRGSPHPRHRSDGIRSQTPDPLSPDHQPPTIRSPTMQQRMRAIGGVPTPLAMSSPIRRSNPGTPNQARRQDYKPNISSANHWQSSEDSTSGEQGQRKYPSEGELGRQVIENHPQTSSTIDNIPELARSPQKGQYSWREQQSPPQRPFQGGYRSNPTSPTQQPSTITSNPPHHTASYNIPPVHRGAQSPQVRRKNYSYAVSPTDPQQYNRQASNPVPRRPVSFVRALEMTDGMELSGRTSHLALNTTHINNKMNSDHSIMSPPREMERKSVYDINYEISV